MRYFLKVICVAPLCLTLYSLSGCRSTIHIESTESFPTPSKSLALSIKENITPSPPPLEQKSGSQKSDNKDIEVSEIETNNLSLEKEFRISSPLQGIEMDELDDINSNPFLFVGAGKDEGHHGTDFSFYQFKEFTKIEELPIQSIFSGDVSAIVKDRPPYGNMIMIETPISEFPDYFQSFLESYIMFENLPNFTNLQCPNYEMDKYDIRSEDLSLYVLYAHLYDPPIMEPGMSIHSGDLIGKVGNTGASGNPHLHLEIRLGPPNYQFPEMAHYDNGASTEEMHNYCLWRVSGYFFQIDPMEIIHLYLQNR